jgi:hypothetical protein
MSDMHWPFRPPLSNVPANTVECCLALDPHAAITITHPANATVARGSQTSWTGSGREDLLWLSLLRRYGNAQKGQATPAPVRED